MIFAELAYDESYGEVHDALVAHLAAFFPGIQSGLQGDSWIWVVEDGQKVAVDTFTAMHHQVKAAQAGPLVQRVIEALSRQFTVRTIEPPEPEAHEDAPA